MFHRSIRPVPGVVAITLLAATSHAHSTQSGVATQAPAALLAEIGAERAVLQDLAFETVGETLRTHVEIAGQSEEVVLWKHSLRSPNYQLLVQGADGEVRLGQPSPVATYRGIVANHPESTVAGSYTGGGLTALIRLDPAADVWSVSPVAEHDADAPASQHVVFPGSDSSPFEGVCGTHPTGFEFHPDAAGGIAAGSGQTTLEIACDTDVQFFNDNGGSISATENDIENTLNGVAGIYLADVDIAFIITTIIVRTAEPDPYTTNNADNLLEEFRIHWTNQQQSVDRDLAHLFSGRNLQGGTIGIAYTGTVCENTLGYGLTERLGGFTNRVSVTAHEIGHNFNAGHCNGTPSGCNIMCSFLGGCGGIKDEFANISKNAISAYALISGCLDDPTPPDAPVINAVVPGQVPALVNGPDTHFSLIGQKLDGVTDVLIDGESLGSGFPPLYTIVSDTQIDCKLPLLDTLGLVDVTVTNITGSDSTIFEIVPASPPALQLGAGNDPETLVSILPVELTGAGQPGNVLFYWASFTLLPTDVPGSFSLDIGNFFLDLYLVDFPIVEAQGWVQRSYSGVNLPPATTIYFQAFEYDVVTGALPLESTNVSTGFWLF